MAMATPVYSESENAIENRRANAYIMHSRMNAKLVNTVFGEQSSLQAVSFLRRTNVIRKSAITLLVIACLVSAPAVRSQANATSQEAPANPSTPATSPVQQNLNEYISLLRKDVRSQKSAIMSSVMQLDPDQAAKFWPIYRDYDAELTKINDLRVANIKEYSQTYNHLTDAKANELIQNAFSYQKQRMDLLTKYYDRVKESLGAVTAARFAQVEHQLLLIIDLQIYSSLPVAGS
jgi:hypothetical protein